MAQINFPKSVLSRAWYGSSTDDFLRYSSEEILGHLTANSDSTVESTQRDAWMEQITVLKESLVGRSGDIFLEFNIPRMGKRIDAVLLEGPVIFAIEFKVGAATFDRAAIDQVWDYALDLKNFHEASHNEIIAPILVATKVESEIKVDLHLDPDDVYRPIKIGAKEIKNVIESVLRHVTGDLINTQDWTESSYCPTPTIIEAARSLYAEHSVDAIARYDAGAKNLNLTTGRIDEIIDHAKEHSEKVICFVTGVPGAGKTLVGLNVSTNDRGGEDLSAHATFCQGMGLW